MVAMLVSRWRSSVLLLSWTLLALSGLPVAQAFAQDAAKVAGTDVPSPKRIKTVLPVYPPDAQAQGIRGIVILELLIDQQGHVASAEVVRSVPGLDDAALAAVKEWEYEVTKVDGKPVSVRLTAPITFTLKPPEISRDKGIPALQQGVPPAYPADLKEKSATVTVQIALDGEGNRPRAEGAPHVEVPFERPRPAARRQARGPFRRRLEGRFAPGRSAPDRCATHSPAGRPGRFDGDCAQAARVPSSPGGGSGPSSGDIFASAASCAPINRGTGCRSAAGRGPRKSFSLSGPQR